MQDRQRRTGASSSSNDSSEDDSTCGTAATWGVSSCRQPSKGRLIMRQLGFSGQYWAGQQAADRQLRHQKCRQQQKSGTSSSSESSSSSAAACALSTAAASASPCATSSWLLFSCSHSPGRASWPVSRGNAIRWRPLAHPCNAASEGVRLSRRPARQCHHRTLKTEVMVSFSSFDIEAQMFAACLKVSTCFCSGS